MSRPGGMTHGRRKKSPQGKDQQAQAEEAQARKPAQE